MGVAMAPVWIGGDDGDVGCAVAAGSALEKKGSSGLKRNLIF